MERLNAPTFFDQALPATGMNALARNLVLVLIGSVLLGLSASAKVPLWPCACDDANARADGHGRHLWLALAGLTVIAYWIQGMVGLPVFANGGGMLYFLGGAPSTGFYGGSCPPLCLLAWHPSGAWRVIPLPWQGPW